MPARSDYLAEWCGSAAARVARRNTGRSMSADRRVSMAAVATHARLVARRRSWRRATATIRETYRRSAGNYHIAIINSAHPRVRRSHARPVPCGGISSSAAAAAAVQYRDQQLESGVERFLLPPLDRQHLKPKCHHTCPSALSVDESASEQCLSTSTIGDTLTLTHSE